MTDINRLVWAAVLTNLWLSTATGNDHNTPDVNHTNTNSLVFVIPSQANSISPEAGTTKHKHDGSVPTDLAEGINLTVSTNLVPLPELLRQENAKNDEEFETASVTGGKNFSSILSIRKQEKRQFSQQNFNRFNTNGNMMAGGMNNQIVGNNPQAALQMVQSYVDNIINRPSGDRPGYIMINSPNPSIINQLAAALAQRYGTSSVINDSMAIQDFLNSTPEAENSVFSGNSFPASSFNPNSVPVFPPAGASGVNAVDSNADFIREQLSSIADIQLSSGALVNDSLEYSHSILHNFTSETPIIQFSSNETKSNYIVGDDIQQSFPDSSTSNHNISEHSSHKDYSLPPQMTDHLPNHDEGITLSAQGNLDKLSPVHQPENSTVLTHDKATTADVAVNYDMPVQSPITTAPLQNSTKITVNSIADSTADATIAKLTETNPMNYLNEIYSSDTELNTSGYEDYYEEIDGELVLSPTKFMRKGGPSDHREYDYEHVYEDKVETTHIANPFFTEDNSEHTTNTERKQENEGTPKDNIKNVIKDITNDQNTSDESKQFSESQEAPLTSFSGRNESTGLSDMEHMYNSNNHESLSYILRKASVDHLGNQTVNLAHHQPSSHNDPSYADFSNYEIHGLKVNQTNSEIMHGAKPHPGIFGNDMTMQPHREAIVENSDLNLAESKNDFNMHVANTNSDYVNNRSLSAASRPETILNYLSKMNRKDLGVLGISADMNNIMNYLDDRNQLRIRNYTYLTDAEGNRIRVRPNFSPSHFRQNDINTQEAPQNFFPPRPSPEAEHHTHHHHEADSASDLTTEQQQIISRLPTGMQHVVTSIVQALQVPLRTSTTTTPPPPQYPFAVPPYPYPYLPYPFIPQVNQFQLPNGPHLTHSSPASQLPHSNQNNHHNNVGDMHHSTHGAQEHQHSHNSHGNQHAHHDHRNHQHIHEHHGHNTQDSQSNDAVDNNHGHHDHDHGHQSSINHRINENHASIHNEEKDSTSPYHQRGNSDSEGNQQGELHRNTESASTQSDNTGLTTRDQPSVSTTRPFSQDTLNEVPTFKPAVNLGGSTDQSGPLFYSARIGGTENQHSGTGGQCSNSGLTGGSCHNRVHLGGTSSFPDRNQGLLQVRQDASHMGNGQQSHSGIVRFRPPQQSNMQMGLPVLNVVLPESGRPSLADEISPLINPNSRQETTTQAPAETNENSQNTMDRQEVDSLLQSLFSSPTLLLLGIIFATSAAYLAIAMEEQAAQQQFQQAQLAAAFGGQPFLTGRKRRNIPNKKNLFKDQLELIEGLDLL